MDSLQEIALRIGCAAAAGIILGANRWLHHKSAGVKTHALVAIGASAAVLGVMRSGPDAAASADLSVDAVSRVLQGLMTGVGFLGAGVIIHNATGNRIQGLTTAASIWITTILGAVIGMGHVALAMTAVLAAGIVLLIGNGIERLVGGRFGQKDSGRSDDVSP